MRGADGRVLPLAAPQLYFSFYTEDIDWVHRRLMWYGVPFGFVLLTCCCCCVLQFFCHTLPRRVRKRRHHQKLLRSGTRRRIPGQGGHCRIDPCAGDEEAAERPEAETRWFAPRAHGRDRVRAVLEARRQRGHV